MKIIDVFNKTANGEEVPPFSIYNETFYINNDYCNYIKSCDNEIVKWAINEDFLNQEIKFLEEEKKIPEKLNYPHIEIESSADDEIRDYLYKVKDKFDEIIDYLKSKGE